MSHIKSRKHAPRLLSGSAAFSPSVTTVLTGLALCCPAAALAQSTAPDSVVTLPSVTVTGTRDTYKSDALDSPKFSQPLVDTTQTVTIINQKLMEDQQATTLTEALRNVPGVGAFYAGENGNTSTGDSIYMRGFDTSSSIFVDGIRDTSSVYRDMFNIDQVEVIKGPSGSDYGRSAPSGSINLVSKQPTLKDRFDASVSLGSDSYKRSTIDWNKKLGDTMAFRLNAFGMGADAAGRDKVDNQRWGIAPTFAFGLGTPTRVFLDVYHVEQKNTPDGGVSTIGLPGYRAPGPDYAYFASAPRVNTNNFYGTTADYDNSTVDMETLRFEHDLSADTTIRNTTRWARTTQDYLLSSFMASAAYLDVGNPSDLSTWTMRRMPNSKDITNEILTNQTNITTKFQTGSLKHDLSAGFELTREKQTNYGLTNPDYSRVSIYYPDSSVNYGKPTRNGASSYGKTDTAAIYAFDTIELNDRWQVNGGLRLDHYRTEYTSSTACGGSGRGAVACGGAPAGTPVTTINGASKSGNLIDWKLGALYRLTPHGNIYVDYAVSQQPPGGANFTLADSGNSANRTDFDPQKAKTFEVGTKWEVLDRKLLLTAALFRTDVSNEVQQAEDGTYQQTAKKRVQGIELGMAGQLTPNWSISAGYTLQNAKVSEGPAITNDGSNNLTYTPRNAFSLWSTYKLPRGFTVGGGARYVGGLTRGSDGAAGTPDGTDAYWVVDAMAGYRVNKNLSLQLNVYNLFDTEYVASINKSGYRYFPGASRSFILTANFSY